MSLYQSTKWDADELFRDDCNQSSICRKNATNDIQNAALTNAAMSEFAHAAALIAALSKQCMYSSNLAASK
jgi:hypothetical protein